MSGLGCGSSRLGLLQLLLLATAFAVPKGARAQPGHEIDNLLEAVRHSRCSFERNGTMFDGPQAAEHLAMKYRSVAANTGVSAEGFIASAGTGSSMSGRPYLVHCVGEPPRTSNAWLTTQLRGIRLMKPKAGAGRQQ